MSGRVESSSRSLMTRSEKSLADKLSKQTYSPGVKEVRYNLIVLS